MFPPEFDYYRATSVEEALELLETHADVDSALLAGGHGLLPDAKTGEAAPEVAIDIAGIDALRGVEKAESFDSAKAGDSDDSGQAVSPVAIGALTTHVTVSESDAVAAVAPVLAEAAGEVGDVQVRNRGTIGGNLAEADPAADLPAAMIAADATLVVRGRDGEREVPADQFFQDAGGTDLGDRELLTDIRVPGTEADDGDAVPAAGGAYAKKTHPATGYALVGVAASLRIADRTVTDARLAASGVADGPVRLTAVEESLAAEDVLVGGDPDRDALAAAAERAGETLDPAEVRSDVAASGEFRLHLLESYAERALSTALDRVQSGACRARRLGGGDR
ncbi:FAD binding domain-containing protein [Halorussus salinisoli]|uniref:FAD binding domain-containing protein n=1 Tax=Halorussus salinisoli TaxID=2558242 RepID=UPI0010C1EDCB|nr:FAD binding domain-containing protein [Halorussus salinisoli]